MSNWMAATMYEFTDKVVKILNKQLITQFGRMAGLLMTTSDEDVLLFSRGAYAEIEQLIEKLLLTIADRTYKDIANTPTTNIGLPWLMSFLKAYNPVTGYSFTNEVARKRDRFAEGILARGKTSTADTRAALRAMAAMAYNYALLVTDEAARTAYKDNGVKRVVWITSEDEKVCGECDEMNGEIYDIDDIPPKPHLNCRCYTLPIEDGEDD